jgi:hypothetical protein
MKKCETWEIVCPAHGRNCRREDCDKMVVTTGEQVIVIE